MRNSLSTESTDSAPPASAASKQQQQGSVSGATTKRYLNRGLEFWDLFSLQSVSAFNIYGIQEIPIDLVVP